MRQYSPGTVERGVVTVQSSCVKDHEEAKQIGQLQTAYTSMSSKNVVHVMLPFCLVLS